MDTIFKLYSYMTGRKALLPLSLFVSILSTITGFIPFVLIWLIIKELILTYPDFTTSDVTSYAVWALIASVLGIVFYFTSLMFSHLAAFRAEKNLRLKSMEKIVEKPLGFFDNNTSGRVRKIIDDNASITHGFLAHQLPDLAGTIIMPFIAIGLVFYFDWIMGIAVIIPIILSVVIMGFMMGKRGRNFMDMYLNSLEEMNTEAVEYVRGIPVVKVFQQTIYSFKNFYNSITNYRDMVTKYTDMWEKPMSTYTVLINGFAFFLIPTSIIIFNYAENLGLVLINLFFFLLITPIFSQCIMRSMYLNQAFGQASEAVKRLENLLDFELLPVPDFPKVINNHNIKFDSVSFSYPGTKNKAISNISFLIEEGQKVALVGPSGSGKTTIARLVPRFWDVDEGSISIGGIDIREVTQQNLMTNISFVFQNTRLFKTTILENILYGNPDATEEEIEKVIDAAQCREIIENLPDGLNTKIGVEGTYLSGGEQQRIVLARAFLKDSPIVILDEATAFADPENEYLIKKALDKLMVGKTVLMIAHRLTSVKDADKILVVNNSKIVEVGKHQELLKLDGQYSRMWNEYKEAAQWTIGKEVQYV